MNRCVSPSCGHPIEDGQKFCSACGAKQEQAPKPPAAPAVVHCAACGAAVDGKFCQQCGASTKSTLPPARKESTVSRPEQVIPPSPAATASDIEWYQEQVDNLGEDGVLEEEELRYLAEARREKRIDIATHNRIVNERRLFEGLPLSVEFDPNRVFLRAGSPSSLSMAVHNLMPGSKSLAKDVQIEYICTTDNTIVKRAAKNIGGGKRQQISFSIAPPPQAGLYEISGIIEARFIDGRLFRGKFQLVGLKAAGAAEMVNGPQSVSITLQGDANMFKGGILPTGRMTEEPTGEILVASGTWQATTVEPATQAELDEWRIAHSSPAHSMPAIVETVKGTPLPCRAVLLRVKNERPTTTDDALMDIWVHFGDSFTIGRDPVRSDYMTAVEPFHPPQQYAYNVQQSMRVSSLHGEFRLQSHGAQFTDLGSSNGTFIHGSRLTARQPQLIATGTEIDIANALTLRTKIYMGDDGFAHALHIERVNNIASRSYVVAPGGLGFWPGETSLVGPRSRDHRNAPIVFDWHQQGLCIRNLGMSGVQRIAFSGTTSRIGIREREALDHRDRIVLGNQWTIFVAEITPLRPGSY